MTQNKLIYLPDNFEETVKTVGNSVIIKKSMDYCQTKSKGGIIIPDTAEADGLNVVEKKAEIGEVIAVGPAVVGLEKGDIVIFDPCRAWKVPNAADGTATRYFKIESNSLDIICVLPKDSRGGEV